MGLVNILKFGRSAAPAAEKAATETPLGAAGAKDLVARFQEQDAALISRANAGDLAGSRAMQNPVFQKFGVAMATSASLAHPASQATQVGEFAASRLSLSPPAIVAPHVPSPFAPSLSIGADGRSTLSLRSTGGFPTGNSAGSTFSSNYLGGGRSDFSLVSHNTPAAGALNPGHVGSDVAKGSRYDVGVTVPASSEGRVAHAPAGAGTHSGNADDSRRLEESHDGGSHDGGGHDGGGPNDTIGKEESYAARRKKDGLQGLKADILREKGLPPDADL